MRSVDWLIGVVLAHIAVVGSTGCYQPVLRDCTVRCSGPNECAAGQVCLEGGYCVDQGVAGCTERGVPIRADAAAVAGDAAAPADARDLCNQGCTNGTCIGGVCTIDCSATSSCQDDVTCPANLPCHVLCGETACAHKVICSLAASCRGRLPRRERVFRRHYVPERSAMRRHLHRLRLVRQAHQVLELVSV